jgi:hypothetical protein
MSSLSMPSAITATLPAMNIHPHGHGHKKDSPLDPSADAASSTSAQTPAASTQNLLGRLFDSLVQLIGLKPPPAAINPAAASANAAASSAATAGSKINAMA